MDAISIPPSYVDYVAPMKLPRVLGAPLALQRGLQRNLKQKLEGLIVIVQQQRTLLGERDVAHREAVRRCEEADDRVQALTIELASSQTEVTNLMRQSSDEEKLKVELNTSKLEVIELKCMNTEQQELAKVSGRDRLWDMSTCEDAVCFDAVCLLPPHSTPPTRSRT
jgi:hypothetical protein